MKNLKRLMALLLAAALVFALAACGSNSNSSSDTETESEESEIPETESGGTEEGGDADVLAETTIYLYAAASMQNAFEEKLIALYNESQPNVKVVGSYDSSGTLQSQIEEANGTGIDIFFSAATSNVSALEEEGLVVEGSRVDLLGNALCLVTYNDSGTAVTGWDNMGDAASMALCDGTVPVGKYTRTLLVKLGLLDETDSPADYTTDDVSAALGGLEINECANVSAATAAVAEHSNEIGTCYYTDYYSVKDDLTIIVMDKDGEYTGEITYPVCQITNGEADEAELAATEDFLAFLQTDEALSVFEEYCFIVR